MPQLTATHALAGVPAARTASRGSSAASSLPRPAPRARCVRVAALGAPPGRPGGGGGLILPGSEGFPESYAGAGDGGSDARQGAGPGRGGPRPGGFAPVAPAQRDGPLYQPFRPPAQYKETAVLPKQELLNRLITRSGRWFELAKALDALHASGTPNTEVFEVTGLTPLEQNAWKVQAAVYVSLEAAEDFPRPLLTHYYDENNAASLAELRNTPEEWRVAAARYVAERKFDVNATRELARAILDFERRPDTTKTFEATPGDALAFKVWRDAGEVPRRMGWQKAVAACVERGCGFASSEGAKARLRSRLDEDARALPGMTGAESGAGRVAATVQTVRLETEESAFRALPLLGLLDEMTPAAVRGAPSAAAEGIFRAFRPASSGAASLAWVALPAWAKLQALDTAVAILVPNAANLKEIPTVCSTPGQILLIIDRAAAAGPTSAQHYYIAAKKPSSLLVGVGGRPLPERVEVVSGGLLAAGAAVLGRIVLVVRPPALGAAKPKNLPEGLRDLGDMDLGDMPEGDDDVMQVAIPDDD